MRILVDSDIGGMGCSMPGEFWDFLAERGLPVVDYSHEAEKRNDRCIFRGDIYNFSTYMESKEGRTDPFILKAVEEFSKNQNIPVSIVEIPDDVEWEIQEHQGTEYICEKHREWWPKR